MEIVESKTPILIISYRNCEIYCCHLDGYKTNREALLDRLSKIEAFFLSKPSHIRFRIWYNVDENSLDKQTMRLIIESISRFREHTYKIAFIGLEGFTKWRFHNILQQIPGNRCITKAYFTDAELAKEWLV
jgi:hypothetical protein